MAERCRDWEHNVSCEYAWDNALEDKPQERTICTCGKGKNGKGFSNAVEGAWKEFEPHVSRIAISTLFAPPYVEATRGFWEVIPKDNFEEVAKEWRILRR
jgi:hypothetical protein